jgi:hypothetical protein
MLQFFPLIDQCCCFKTIQVGHFYIHQYQSKIKFIQKDLQSLRPEFALQNGTIIFQYGFH